MVMLVSALALLGVAARLVDLQQLIE
jgi:hypothetical protein